jgi:hypothetical protein
VDYWQQEVYRRNWFTVLGSRFAVLSLHRGGPPGIAKKSEGIGPSETLRTYGTILPADETTNYELRMVNRELFSP